MKKTNLCVMLLFYLLLSVSNNASASNIKYIEKKIICIDPGHQKKGNYKKEPNGPGSQELKIKVSQGTTGVLTKKPEYVLTLEIANKLKKELEKNGYKVVMTRNQHEVDISNKERAEYCNKESSNLSIRIHADGSDLKKVEGISVLYPGSNKYTKNIYDESKKAAKLVLENTIKETKAKSRGIFKREDLTGFNWAKIPSILIELGFMTNPSEDKRMGDSKYQDKLVKGILNGINEYFKIKKEG